MLNTATLAAIPSPSGTTARSEKAGDRRSVRAASAASRHSACICASKVRIRPTSRRRRRDEQVQTTLKCRVLDRDEVRKVHGLEARRYPVERGLYRRRGRIGSASAKLFPPNILR